MPWLLTFIGVGIKVFAAYAITRILIALGLSYVVISGFDELQTQFGTLFQTYYGQFPAAIYDICTLAGADVAITILLSCVTVRMIMNGLSQGIIGTLAFRGISGAAQ